MTATKAELEALKLAIETERKGYDFFKKPETWPKRRSPGISLIRWPRTNFCT
jgi:hypothetical protein